MRTWRRSNSVFSHHSLCVRSECRQCGLRLQNSDRAFSGSSGPIGAYVMINAPRVKALQNQDVDMVHKSGAHLEVIW